MLIMPINNKKMKSMMKNWIFKNIRHYPVYGIFLGCLYFISCDPAPEVYENCKWDPRGRDCRGFSISIVDAETNENLVGKNGEPIHPDSIIIYNTRGDEMPIDIRKHEPAHLENGWYTIDRFSPFDELYCFNMCTNDSSFTRTYYMYLGNGDMDTIEAYFPARTNPYKVLYNGSFENALNDWKDSGLDSALDFTTHWFLKEIK